MRTPTSGRLEVLWTQPHAQRQEMTRESCPHRHAWLPGLSTCSSSPAWALTTCQRSHTPCARLSRRLPGAQPVDHPAPPCSAQQCTRHLALRPCAHPPSHAATAWTSARSELLWRSCGTECFLRSHSSAPASRPIPAAKFTESAPLIQPPSRRHRARRRRPRGALVPRRLRHRAERGPSRPPLWCRMAAMTRHRAGRSPSHSPPPPARLPPLRLFSPRPAG